MLTEKFFPILLKTCWFKANLLKFHSLLVKLRMRGKTILLWEKIYKTTMCTYLYLDRHNKLNYIFSEPSFTAWFWIRSTTANTTITSSIINCPEFCQLSQTTILSFTPSPDKSANDILSMLIWKMKTSSDPNLLTWVYYKILKNMSTHFDFFCAPNMYHYDFNS